MSKYQIQNSALKQVVQCADISEQANNQQNIYFLKLLKSEDQQFLIIQQQINSYYSHKYKNHRTCMAHLRTSFIQTCNNSSSLFSSMSGIVSSMGSLFNNEEKDDGRNIHAQQDRTINKNYRSLTFARCKQYFSNDLQRSLHGMMNLNINNLSHLLDRQNNDFKGHDNFVHVLQLQAQAQKEQKLLDSLQTLQSLNMDMNELNNFESPNSTRIFTQYVRDNDSEFSQVETFQI